ncbi:MAG: hypothetical protein QG674_202, partial [Patescibacteria group bacterium]|nr:hypothetical protein [Patescibacteria group bacterium]
VSSPSQEKLIKMCNDIVNNSENPNPSGSDIRFRIYAEWPHATYSVMAYFPYKEQYICMGSSYKFSYVTKAQISSGIWVDFPGCYNNP